jgi:uncharacterized lipoprotein YddW (UPF0748 family)
MDRLPSIRRLAVLSSLAFVAACAANPSATPSVPSAAPAAGPDAPPPVRREFRAVWVATVANIDWPSRPGLPADSQRAELLRILDRSAALKLNAVILQVRPAGDALYPSTLEPWSEYLTGAQGRPPEPAYDPLAFAVEEAHRRGLELHAWFNPYRARHPTAKSEPVASHLSRARPELVKRYGSYLWMDPGEPAVQDHSVAVMMDVVRRYDLDGVHIDDYFYPYPERDSATGQPIPFPDEPSWQRYQASGGRLSRDDWRRRNVDVLIERLYGEIKREKPWVKFGISPFGIYRPGQPVEARTGFDQYAQLYADARKWLVEGWMDYFTPQLYWPIAQEGQSYPFLLRWWVAQNTKGRHMWPGNFTSRMVEGNPRVWPASEIIGQIQVTRAWPGATGNVHFSAKAFMLNPDSLVERLQRGVYAEPALVPASPWLGGRAPGAPSVTLRGAGVAFQPAAGDAPMWWVVRARAGTQWRTEVLPGWRRDFTLPAGQGGAAVEVVHVSAVDRLGNEGRATVARR